MSRFGRPQPAAIRVTTALRVSRVLLRTAIAAEISARLWAIRAAGSGSSAMLATFTFLWFTENNGLHRREAFVAADVDLDNPIAEDFQRAVDVVATLVQ